MNSIDARIEQMPRPAQMYYAQLIEQADGDVIAAIDALRESQADGSIEPELRPAANLAMAKMVGHLNGDSKPRQLTPAEAQHDIRQRLEEARLAGDRKTFDALTAALAHGEKKAAQAASLLKKRNTELEATQQTFAAEKKAQYLELKQAFKDAELHRLRVGGLTGDDAEAQYNLLSASSVEEAARAGSGYSPPREEIPVGA